MKKQFQVSLLAIFLTIFLCTVAWAAGHGHKAPKKGGYLTGGFRIQRTQRPGVL